MSWFQSVQKWGLFFIFSACFLLAHGCRHANEPAQCTPDHPTISPDGHFEFHIDPWVGLHHFTFQLARREHNIQPHYYNARIRPADLLLVSDEYQVAFEEAYKAYEPYLNERLVFSDRLIGILNDLTDRGSSGFSDEHVTRSLAALMPHYMNYHWPAHEARSRAMCQELLPLLQKHEAVLSQFLAESISSEWGDEPIRVDLVAYANWAGAYTVTAPNRITMSSTDPQLVAGYALELLFHEALHSSPLGATFRERIDAALLSADIVDKRLWHHILFFVSGQAVRAALKDENYELYASRVNLTERNKLIYRALNKAWSSDHSFEDNLAKLVRQIQNERAHEPQD